MYQVFPAYDKLECWKDHVHGGTGPTLAGQDPQQPQQADDAQQQLETPKAAPQQARRSLSASRASSIGQPLVRPGYDEDPRAKQPQAYLFEWEKHPQKYLSFVLPDLADPKWRYAGTERYDGGNQGLGVVDALVYKWDLTGMEEKSRVGLFLLTQGGPANESPKEIRIANSHAFRSKTKWKKLSFGT
jgi:hypothetical protein